MFQEVLENIWYIPAKDNGKYPYANSIFINDEQKLLIDTGVGRRFLKKVIKTFGQPDIILYSHGHEDHTPVGNLFSTQNRYIHGDDILAAGSRDELARLYGVTDEKGYKLIDGLFQTLNWVPLKDLQTLENGTIFDLGDIQVKCIHAPGHCAGHTVFEVMNEQLIFSADIDLSSFGPFYGVLDGSIKDFEKSINMLKEKSPKILITSHKGVFTSEIQERLTVYLKKIYEREERILGFIEKPKTLEDIVSATFIYQRPLEPKEWYEPAERLMVIRHLEFLLERGKIEQIENSYRKI